MATKEEDAVVEMFVTSTHNPVLFFTNTGQVYRLKVWKLPEGGPTDAGPADGQPAAAGRRARRITTVLPLPEDEDDWGALNIVFATEQGHGPPQLDGCLHQRAVQRQIRDGLRRRTAETG